MSSTSIPVGRLRSLVEVEEQVSTVLSTGETTESWQRVAYAYASISAIGVPERIQADAVESRLSHRIIMRYDAGLGLNTRHRLKLGTRIFNIHSVSNRFERNHYYDVMAEEVTS